MVLRTLPDMFLYLLYTVQRAFPLTGAVTVIDELLFQQRDDAPGYQMMHHTVAEIRCEDLPLHGFGDDESDGTRRVVCAGVNLTPQFHTLAFVVALEGKGIVSVPLLLPALEVCLEDILQRNASEFLLRKKCFHLCHAR